MKPQASLKLAMLLCRFKDTAQNESTDKHFIENLKVGHGLFPDYSYERSPGVIKTGETQPGEYFGKKDLTSAVNPGPEAVDLSIKKELLLAFQLWN